MITTQPNHGLLTCAVLLLLALGVLAAESGPPTRPRLVQVTEKYRLIRLLHASGGTRPPDPLGFTALGQGQHPRVLRFSRVFAAALAWKAINPGGLGAKPPMLQLRLGASAVKARKRRRMQKWDEPPKVSFSRMSRNTLHLLTRGEAPDVASILPVSGLAVVTCCSALNASTLCSRSNQEREMPAEST